MLRRPVRRAETHAREQQIQQLARGARQETSRDCGHAANSWRSMPKERVVCQNASVGS